jgi:hypothetical protein
MKSRTLISFSCLISLTLALADEPELAFLRDRVSVTTSSGVRGFAPGTRVIVIARRGGKVTVKSEDQQFDVSADQLMSDAQVARTLSTRDAAEQQAVQQQIAQQEAARSAAQQKIYQSAAPNDPKASLDAQLRETQAQRQKIEAELHDIHDAQNAAGPANHVTYTKGHTAWGHIKSISTSTNTGELAAREKDLRQKIEDLKRKEQWLREKLK